MPLSPGFSRFQELRRPILNKCKEVENLLIIKPIFNDYCPQVIDIVLGIQQGEFGLPITLDDQPDLHDIESNYRTGRGNFWGAFLGEELIGTIALMNGGQGLGAIRKMFVKKEYRGKDLGVAQQLLDNLIGFCRNNQFTDLYLGTTSPLIVLPFTIKSIRDRPHGSWLYKLYRFKFRGLKEGECCIL